MNAKNADRANRTRRLSGDDWIEAASQAIIQGGVAAVAVEPLAQRLGVTKGSFYWHFPNRDALLRATLERWERDVTEAAIAALDQIPDPRERLATLVERALTDDRDDVDPAAPVIPFGHAFQLAVGDAAADPIVQPVLWRVSQRRIDYLTGCFAALGLAPAEARHRALIAYAAYVGALRLAREVPGGLSADEAAGFRQHILATLMPAGD